MEEATAGIMIDLMTIIKEVVDGETITTTTTEIEDGIIMEVEIKIQDQEVDGDRNTILHLIKFKINFILSYSLFTMN